MALRTSVFIATSLDGFIAREDDTLDWLYGQATDIPVDEDEDYGYREFMDSVDALVMGRRTFEKVVTFGSWPYGDKPVFVLSHDGVAIPEELIDRVRTLTGEPKEVAEILEKNGHNHVYLDGGNTIQGFARAGLLDTLIITRIPVLLGQGVPLFGSLSQDIRLNHGETRAFPNGFVQSRYRVIRP